MFVTETTKKRIICFMRNSTSAFISILLMSHFSNAQKLNKQERKVLKDITTSITYLASDQLEGRLTGSEGEKLSAEYIAAEFKAMGLKPLGDNGTYFQTFNITTLRMTTDKS